MSYSNGPRIVTDGLILYWDVANSKSYTSGSSTIYDLSGNNNNGTVYNNYITYSSDFGGVITFNGTADSRVSIGGTSFDKRTGTYTVIAASRYYGATRGRLITSFNNWLLGHWASRSNVHYAEGWVEYYATFPPATNDTKWRIYTATGNTNTDTWQFYINNTLMTSNSNGFNGPYGIQIGGLDAENSTGQFSFLQFYNRVLSANEISQNYNALKGRFIPNGTILKPFDSPAEAQSLGYGDGNYYFFSGFMSTPRLLEFKNNYYENKSWVCVFRSPYNSTATTNELGLSIPMGGLLVQRDSLDLRAAVYWSTPISYNSGLNDTADSGYSPRRVILGSAGGHGIYATNQTQCNWQNATGAIGAGWNGSTCGSFPNGLLWGTGQSNTATYTNMSGTWSHWIYWQ